MDMNSCPEAVWYVAHECRRVDHRRTLTCSVKGHIGCAQGHEVMASFDIVQDTLKRKRKPRGVADNCSVEGMIKLGAHQRTYQYVQTPRSKIVLPDS